MAKAGRLLPASRHKTADEVFHYPRSVIGFRLPDGRLVVNSERNQIQVSGAWEDT